MAQLRIRGQQLAGQVQSAPRVSPDTAIAQATGAMGDQVARIGAQMTAQEKQRAEEKRQRKSLLAQRKVVSKMRETAQGVWDDTDDEEFDNVRDMTGDTLALAMPTLTEGVDEEVVDDVKQAIALEKLNLDNKAINIAAGMGARAAGKDFDGYVQQIGVDIGAEPFNDDVYDEGVKSFNELTKTYGHIPKELLAKVREAKIEELQSARINALLNQPQATAIEGAEKVIADINTGKFDGLSPQKQESYRARAISIKESYQSSADGSVRNAINSEAKLREQTGIPSSNTETLISKLEPEEQAIARARLDSSLRIGQTRNEYLLTSPDKIQERSEQLLSTERDPKASQSKREMAARERQALSQVLSERNSLLVEDRGQLANESPSVRIALATFMQSMENLQTEGIAPAQKALSNYKTYSYSAQRHMGVPPGAERLPKEMLSSIAASYVASENAEDNFLSMQQAQQIYGSDAIQQMYAAMPEMRQYNVIQSMDPNDGRTAMLARSKMKENKDILGKSANGMEEQVEANLQNYFSTTRNKDDVSALALKDVTMAMAYHLMRGGQDIKKAAESAAGVTINQNSHWIEGSDGTTRARAPKLVTDPETGEMIATTEDAMYYVNEGTINYLSDSKITANLLAPAGDKTQQEAWRKAVADSGIYPQNSDNGLGLNYTDIYGNALRWNDGRIVYVPFGWMQNAATSHATRSGAGKGNIDYGVWIKESHRDIGYRSQVFGRLFREGQ